MFLIDNFYKIPTFVLCQNKIVEYKYNDLWGKQKF